MTDQWISAVVDQAVVEVCRTLPHLPVFARDQEAFLKAVGTPEAPGPLRLALYDDPKLRAQARTLRVQEATEIILHAQANLTLNPNKLLLGNDLMPHVLVDLFGVQPTPEEVRSAVARMLSVNLDSTDQRPRGAAEMDDDELAAFLADVYPTWRDLLQKFKAQKTKPHPPKRPTEAQTEKITKKVTAASPVKQTRQQTKWDEAEAIGRRVLLFMDAFHASHAEGTEAAEARATARAYWYELNGSLWGWMASHAPGHEQADGRKGALALLEGKSQDLTGDEATYMAAFIAAWSSDGSIDPLFVALPDLLKQWPGPWGPDRWDEIATWLHEARGPLPVHKLIAKLTAEGQDGMAALRALYRPDSGWWFVMDDKPRAGSPGALGQFPTLMVPYADFTTGNALSRRSALTDALNTDMTADDEVSLWLRERTSEAIEKLNQTVDLTGAETVLANIDVRDTYIPGWVMDDFINARVQLQDGDYAAVWMGRSVSMTVVEGKWDKPEAETNRHLHYFDPTAAPTLATEGKDAGKWIGKHILDFGERRDDFVVQAGFSPVKLRLRRTRFSIALAYVKTYVLAPGDTRQMIADRFAMTVADLDALNPSSAFASGSQVQVWTPLPWAVIQDGEAFKAYFRLVSERVRFLVGYLANSISVFKPNNYTSEKALKRLFAEDAKKAGQSADDYYKAEPWPGGETTLLALPGMRDFVPAGRNWTLGDLQMICKAMPNATEKPAAYDKHIKALNALFPAMAPSEVDRLVRGMKRNLTESRTDRQRGRYAAAWNDALRRFLSESEPHREAVVRGYNNVWKSYVVPDYPTDGIGDELVRTGDFVRGEIRKGAKVPYPYQSAASRRLVHEGGGLLAFGVGVGKTNTALFALGLARQQGLAKRPVILVPNSLERKWADDLRDVFPDYRVEIIGTKLVRPKSVPANPRDPLNVGLHRIKEALLVDYRILTREAYDKKIDLQAPISGVWVRWGIQPVPSLRAMKKDPSVYHSGISDASNLLAHADASYLVLNGGEYEGRVEGELQASRVVAAAEPRPVKERPEESADKWEEFRRGRYDAVIVPYSAFDAVPLDEDKVTEHVMGKTSILRAIEPKLYSMTEVDQGKGKKSIKIAATEAGILQGQLRKVTQILNAELASATTTQDILQPPPVLTADALSPLTPQANELDCYPTYVRTYVPLRYGLDGVYGQSGKSVLAVVPGGGPAGPSLQGPVQGQWTAPLGPVPGGGPQPGPVRALKKLAQKTNRLRIRFMPATAKGKINAGYAIRCDEDLLFLSQKLYVADFDRLSLPKGANLTLPDDPKAKFIRLGAEIAQVIRVEEAPKSGRPYIVILRNPFGTLVEGKNGTKVQGAAPSPNPIPAGTPVTPLVLTGAAELASLDIPPGMDLQSYAALLERRLTDPTEGFRVEAVRAWIGERLERARQSAHPATYDLYKDAFGSPEAYHVVDGNGDKIEWGALGPIPDDLVEYGANHVVLNPHVGEFYFYGERKVGYTALTFSINRSNVYPDGGIVPHVFKRSGVNKPKGRQRNGAWYVLGHRTEDQPDVVLTAQEAAERLVRAINQGRVSFGGPFPVSVVPGKTALDFTNPGNVQAPRFKGKRIEQAARRLSLMPAPPQACSARFGGRMNTWEDLGCDFLVVDEAHNFKKLYESGRWGSQGGGQVEFLDMQGDAKRGWQMAFRTAAIRANKGRVTLLTATPASTSPLEFYNLLQYLGRPGQRDVSVFDPLGIEEPGQFVARFVEIRKRIIAKPGGAPKERFAATEIQNSAEFQTVFARYANFKTVDDAPALRGRTVAAGQELEVEVVEEDGYFRGVFSLPANLGKVSMGDRLRVTESNAAGDYRIMRVDPDTGTILTEYAPSQLPGDEEIPKWEIFTGGRVPIAPPTARLNLGMSPEQDQRYTAYQAKMSAAARGKRAGLGLMGVLHKMSRTASHLGLEWFAPQGVTLLTLEDDNSATPKGKKPKTRQAKGDTYTDALRAALPMGKGGALAEITPSNIVAQPLKGLTQEDGEDGRTDLLRIRWVRGKDVDALRGILVIPPGKDERLPMTPAPFAPDPGLFGVDVVNPLVMTDPLLGDPRQLLEVVLAFRPGSPREFGKTDAKTPFLAVWRTWVVAGAVKALYMDVEAEWLAAIELQRDWDENPQGPRPPDALSPARVLNAVLAEVIYRSRVLREDPRTVPGQGALAGDPGQVSPEGAGWDHALLEYWYELRNHAGNAGHWFWGSAYLPGGEALGRARIKRGALTSLLAFSPEVSAPTLVRWGVPKDEVDAVRDEAADLRRKAR